MTTRADLVQRVAVALLRGAVLQVSDVTVGRGTVVDWRQVKSGEDVTSAVTREAWRTPVEEPWGVDLEWRSGPDASAFGLALAFVELVGVEAARGSLACPSCGDTGWTPGWGPEPCRACKLTTYLEKIPF